MVYKIVRAGDGETAVAGFGEAAIAGRAGCAITGNYGNSIAGDYGLALTTLGGKAIVGKFGQAQADHPGMVAGGDGSELRLRYLDETAGRMRTVIRYVGEDGIKPNVHYRLDKKRNFKKAE